MGVSAICFFLIKICESGIFLEKNKVQLPFKTALGLGFSSNASMKLLDQVFTGKILL